MPTMADAPALDNAALLLKTKKKLKNSKRPKSQRKSRTSEWGGALPWKNVTPDDSLALLVGSDQGGFMCLEEVDGDLYSQLEGNVGHLSASPVEGHIKKPKKRKGRKDGSAVETAEVEETSVLPSQEGLLALDGSTRHVRVGTKKRKRSNKKKGKTRSNGDGDMVAKMTGLENSDERTEDHEQYVSSVEYRENQNERNLDDVSAWAELRLHWKIIKAIATMGFTQPTPIQAACIPAAAYQGKDVVGAAETGSGKTLAYVIPILQRLLEEEDKYAASNKKMDEKINSRKSANGGPIRALIVTPTRELALQVCDHFRAAAKYTTIKVVPIVGGMATQKQQRLLRQRPQAVVGTPGRLWELMSAGENHLIELHSLSFFVLDEADRMVEKGHFQELQSIMSMLPRDHKENKKISFNQRRVGTDDMNLEVSADVTVGSHTSPDGESHATDMDAGKLCKRRQTFVFSATLALPPGFKKKLKKGFLKPKPVSKNDDCSVAALSERAGVRHNAAIFNLTSENILANKLEESTIQCREEEKDAYLYYILKLHGCGRTIVFCTSIAAVRRVSALLHLLQVSASPLHAQMQQRQRLKAMDRFCGNENSVLIATDVAARGLDIVGVRTVIHYQLPHSAEVYVHRSGRTARALNDGCSILLVSPPDQMKYSTLCHALCKRQGLSSFPINISYMPAIQRRIHLAHQIDSLLRKNAQLKAKTTWLKRNADALEIDIEDGGSDGEENDIAETHRLGKKEFFQLKNLQQELQDLLDQPLEPKSFSHCFITGAGISPLVAGQLKDYATAKQNMFKKSSVSIGRSNKIGFRNHQSRKGLVVIGQATVEPLTVLRTSSLL